MKSILTERKEMYRLAIESAKSEGATSKVRRFERGMKVRVRCRLISIEDKYQIGFEKDRKEYTVGSLLRRLLYKTNIKLRNQSYSKIIRL